MSGGGALICGGSSCTVADLEFPAGINHKLLFKINTMINTVCGTSMPAENCTDPDWIQETFETLITFLTIVNGIGTYNPIFIMKLQ